MKTRNLILFAFLVTITAYIFFQFAKPTDLPNAPMSAIGSETIRARVIEVIDDGETDLGGTKQRYQVARVKLQEGEYKDLVMEMDYGRRQVISSGLYLKPGDDILVTIGSRLDGVLTVYFVDFMRIRPLMWLLASFFVAIIFISGWKGFRALLSMIFSLAMIIGIIIPRILTGDDPLLVSIFGSMILLGVTLYLTYGWNLKTHSAVMSMVLVLLITGTLSGLFVLLTKLTGSGDENSLFLVQMLGTQINTRGLLLGGLIIGALGVLDDLVTTQASAVFELRHANLSLGFRGLYQAAMRIGQDHVAATVNTLVLAYVGASLPMLLMFSLGRGNLSYLVNFEVVAEEIVRTLVGSLGLISAVPITTAIAILMALRADSLQKWEHVLGPEGGGGVHGHSH